MPRRGKENTSHRAGIGTIGEDTERCLEAGIKSYESILPKRRSLAEAIENTPQAIGIRCRTARSHDAVVEILLSTRQAIQHRRCAASRERQRPELRSARRFPSCWITKLAGWTTSVSGMSRRIPVVSHLG